MISKQEQDKQKSQANETLKHSRFSLKYVFIVILFIFIGIFANFPFNKILKNVSSSFMSKIHCPITSDYSKFSLIPPNYIFKKLIIPSSCSSGNIANLEIDRFKIQFNGPSFFPPGVRVELITQIKKSTLQIKTLISLSSIKLKIQKGHIDAQLINQLISQDNLLDGHLFLKSLLTFKNNLPSKGSFSIYSKDLMLNSKSIMGFTLPAMRFGFAKLVGQVDSPTSIHLSNITLGNHASPIILHLRGGISLNKHNLIYSKINLKGEVKFSKNLMNQISILSLFLNGKKKSHGFYKLMISGSFANPRPKIL